MSIRDLLFKPSGGASNLCLVILLFVAFGCVCSKKSNLSEIQEGAPLPIDGLWAMYTYAGVYQITLKIEKGRGFAVETNTLYTKDNVVLNNIKNDADNKYSATFTDVVGYRVDVKLAPTSESEITIEVPYAPDIYLKKTSAPAQDDAQKSGNNGAPPPGSEGANVGVELITFKEERLKALEQEQNVEEGAQISVVRSRTIKHEVSFESTSGTEISAEVEGSGKVNVGAILINKELSLRLQAGIRGRIEERVGRKFGEEETFTTTVTIDGKKSRKWKFIWYDRVRTGVARYTDEKGNKHDIPYRFPVVSELDVMAEK